MLCDVLLTPAACAAVLLSEMGYDATKDDEPVGEVLLRGPQLFSGYFKQVGAMSTMIYSIPACCK